MRRFLLLAILLVVPGLALAVPRRLEEYLAVPPLSAEEASAFAGQLRGTIDRMVKQYARPVQRADLIIAALKELHLAAGQAVPLSLPSDVRRAGSDDEKLVELITQVRKRLGNLSALQGTKALEASLVGTLKCLDPYCFLAKGDVYSIASANEGDGVGLETEETAGPLRIKTVVPGGPAQRSGLLPGDLITHLEGQALKERSAAQALDLWRELAQRGRTVPFTLVVQRPRSKAPRKVILEPGPFQVDTVFGVHRTENNRWNYLLDPKQKLGYIRLDALKQGTAAELHKVLEALHKPGLRGLVLDLRWCPGGLLDEAVEAACLVVGDKPIATINYRDGRKFVCTRDKTSLVEGRGSSYLDFPLVVLVNGETRGGGELLAAAVQDNKRGAIVGQRTIGKGSVQNALLNDQGALYYPVPGVSVRLSVGLFVRTNGKSLNRFAASKPGDDWGVRPDRGLEFPISTGLSQKLRDWYQLRDLRPAWSDEALPVDDPENDAQLLVAVQTLRKMLAKGQPAR